jgi:tRNA pseudouridine38-40 synthase
MRNILVEIQFFGAHYHGWQVQQNALSVQEVMQNAVEAVLHRREDITGCSRTDAGVHANSYFFHMHTDCRIPVQRLTIALNRALPNDIAVLRCIDMPMEFHARYSCSGKEYEYRIWNSATPNPFLEHMTLLYRWPIDENLLHQQAQDYLGTHDFSAFCSQGSSVVDNVRTIHHVSVTRENTMVIFRVEGDGFLYNMVRIMVGTLLFIQAKRIAPGSIPQIIASKDRALAGKTVGPEGLYLNRIFYQSPYDSIIHPKIRQNEVL